MTDTLFYRRGDADPAALEGETVAVIGYGNLGRSMALNLRDSGVEVVVGNRDDEYRATAVADGMKVLAVPEAAAAAGLAYLLVPDEVIGDLYTDQIGPHLAAGAALVLGSGYALAYGLVEPAAELDVILLAPRMLGEEVRTSYLDGRGFFSYVSVEQDASGRARQRLLALALAAGSLQRGAMELPAAQEAFLDLLIEQTVGPFLGTAIQLAFETGVGAGLPAEALVLEMYMSGEMSRTFQTFGEVGFYRSANWHGLVAQFGGFLRTLAIDRQGMARLFAEVAEDIRSGGFAAKLQDEHDRGYPTAAAIELVTAGEDPMSQAEARVRQALAAGPD
ncbi:MAG TPA: NAD(P)-binding domain-containing protein [Acidimicrobiales bacterium]|nr:NAD(P)-binding domain-containing protein [Acidimicrobiales bacterium]